MATESGVARPLNVEVRSIDYVPQADRHGKVWHQGPLWFAANAQLVTLATGVVGVSLGLGAGWALLAILIGVAFGTFFDAFHGVQGPRMGLPQMIQSRPQFGYRGALVAWIIALIVYIGSNVLNTLLSQESVDSIAPSKIPGWLVAVVYVALSGVLAVWGYDLIHLAQRWIATAFIVVFGIYTIGALAVLSHDLGSFALSASSFQWPAFLTQLGVAVSFQIAYAPLISDYTRYLPRDTKATTTFWWVYLSNGLSAFWLMSLGALLFTAYPKLSAVGGVKAAGDHIFNGFGAIAIIISLFPLITVSTLDVYGGALTSIGLIDAFRKVRLTRQLRVWLVLLLSAVILVLALAIPGSFIGTLTNYFLLLLYFLVPWTAINLMDFYFVRHGEYAITEIFNPSGIYERWAWRGLVAYFAGFAVMIPFMSFGLFEGPIAKALGGADISFLIGLPVAGGLYYVFSRSLDRSAELRIADEERDRLESLGRAHLRPELDLGSAEGPAASPLPGPAQ